MIPGTTAEQLLLIQDTGGLSLLASLDFVAGTYSVNGGSVSDSDVVSDVSRISGSGFSITGTSPSVSLINDVADIIKAGNYTVVVEFFPTGTGHVILIDGLKGDNNDETVLYIDGSATLYDLHGFFDANPFAERTVFGIDVDTTDTINKVAAYRTDGVGAVSLNGETPQTDDTDAVGVIIDTVYIAYKTGTAGGYIRKIDVYSGGTIADLQTLSAP